MKLDLSNFLVSMFVAGAFAQYPYCNCGNSDIQCGYNDEQVFNNGGKTYTAYCNKLDDYGGANLKYFVADSVKACVKACSEYPDNKCKRAIWQTSAASGGQTGCWLREWNNVDCVPTTKSTAYSSAHVHDSKCPQ
ncbi:hypothetical protein NUH16_003259 [Penicillium rubens]|nr:hypothetical protein NUH16_003259 [Penicillium rubens]